MILLEDILSQENMKQAMKQVIANKGAPGIDGLPCSGLLQWIYEHPGQISNSIIQGSYKPSLIRRVYIPKRNGKLRPLGIPTVVDRLIQQAVSQRLQEQFDPRFSEYSYGFRPCRSAHQAIRQAQTYLNEGYKFLVELDLEKFFDTIPHALILKLIKEKVDHRVYQLIKRLLKAKIIDNGTVLEPKQGAIQGAPCSPVLANIVLNELDKRLESRGLRFIRYADDMIIFLGSLRAAKRVYQSITRFIENTLGLKVNHEKTLVGRVGDHTKFLGFGFSYLTTKGKKGILTPCMHKKTIQKFRKKVKYELLDKKAPQGIEKAKERFKRYVIGWAGYFSIGYRKTTVKELDKWIRRRVRALYLKQWKNLRTIQENLIQLKTNTNEVCQMLAYSSHKVWAKSKIMNPVITKKIIQRKWGWLSLERIFGNKLWKVYQDWKYQRVI